MGGGEVEDVLEGDHGAGLEVAVRERDAAQGKGGEVEDVRELGVGGEEPRPARDGDDAAAHEVQGLGELESAGGSCGSRGPALAADSTGTAPGALLLVHNIEEGVLVGGWRAGVVVLVFAASAAAQAPAPATSPSPSPSPAASEPADPDPDSADISFTSTVRYKELKFESVGTPKVEFQGGVDAPALGTRSELKTVWHTDRGNLPRPVSPGVIYRDGEVRLTITSRFEDLARMLAEPAPTPMAPSPSPSPTPVP